MLSPSLAEISPSHPPPPSSCAENDVFCYGMPLWPVGASCPGHAPSQLLVHLLSSRARETEKRLTYGKHCSATTTTSVCCQHYSHPKFKYAALYQLLRGKLTPSQPKPAHYSMLDILRCHQNKLILWTRFTNLTHAVTHGFQKAFKK